MRKNTDTIRKSFRYNGKTYDVYGKSEAELIRKKTQKIEAMKRGEVLVCSSMPFSEWADMCVDTYKTNLAAKTLNNYKYALDHYVKAEIGHMKLKDIKPLTCQKCLNNLNGYSNYTIGYVYQIMTFVFSKAVENGLLNKNPAANITKPRGKAYKHRRALTSYEEGIFIKAIEKHPHKLFFLLMYGCGCRPSEAARVRGCDIEHKYNKAFLHIRGTKTVNSDRYVPLPDIVKNAIPENANPFQPLCLTYQGKPLTERSITRAWHSLKRYMNIEMGCKVYRNQLVPPYPLAEDLCLYCLRHTYCTNLQKKGVDLREAQKLMGHADIQMTANIYTHVDIEQLANDWDLINGTAAESDQENAAENQHKIFKIG